MVGTILKKALVAGVTGLPLPLVILTISIASGSVETNKLPLLSIIANSLHICVFSIVCSENVKETDCGG